MAQLRVEPTLLDAHTKMLHECSLFSSHAVSYVQQAREFASAVSGFLGEIDSFEVNAGYPSVWRERSSVVPPAHPVVPPVPAAGPQEEPRPPPPRPPATAAGGRIEAAPIDIPQEHQELFKLHVQHECVKSAQEAVDSAIGGRAVRPFEAWMEVYRMAKAEGLTHLERLRRDYDERRVRVEGARMEVLAEESKNPLTVSPGTSGYSPEQLAEVMGHQAAEGERAAGSATAPEGAGGGVVAGLREVGAKIARAAGAGAGGGEGRQRGALGGVEALKATTGDAGLAQLQAGGQLCPLPAIQQRDDLRKRESEMMESKMIFDLEERKVRSTLSWLVSTAGRLKAYAAYGALHALDTAGCREVPLELLPAYPEHLLPPSRQRPVSDVIREDHGRLRRTIAAYRDAMGQEAAAEAVAAGAEMLAAAAPDVQVALAEEAPQQQGTLPEGMLREQPGLLAPPPAAGAPAAPVFPQVAAVRVALSVAPGAAAVAAAGGPSGAGQAVQEEEEGRVTSVAGEVLPEGSPQALPQAAAELLSLGVARQADAARARAAGRREALAKRMAWETAAHEAAEEEVLYPAIEQFLGATLSERLRRDHRSLEAMMDDLGRMDPGDRAFDTLALRAAAVLEAHMKEEEEEQLPLLAQAPGMTPAELRGLAVEFAAARSRRPERQIEGRIAHW